MAFRTEALALLKKHGGALPADHMLAMAAHMVGQIVALQDQRTMSRERALEIVTHNIEVVNAEVVASLDNTRGSA
jgi:hypothetical protein